MTCEHPGFVAVRSLDLVTKQDTGPIVAHTCVECGFSVEPDYRFPKTTDDEDDVRRMRSVWTGPAATTNQHFHIKAGAITADTRSEERAAMRKWKWMCRMVPGRTYSTDEFGDPHPKRLRSKVADLALAASVNLLLAAFLGVAVFMMLFSFGAAMPLAVMVSWVSAVCWFLITALDLAFGDVAAIALRAAVYACVGALILAGAAFGVSILLGVVR